MFKTVLVEEKRRIMQMPIKATWEHYCPSGKNVKLQKPEANLAISIPPIKPICDEMVQKCLIYLFNNQKYYLENF